MTKTKDPHQKTINNTTLSLIKDISQEKKILELEAENIRLRIQLLKAKEASIVSEVRSRHFNGSAGTISINIETGQASLLTDNN